MSPQLLTINIHTRRSDTVVADVVPDDDTDDEQDHYSHNDAHHDDYYDYDDDDCYYTWTVDAGDNYDGYYGDCYDGRGGYYNRHFASCYYIWRCCSGTDIGFYGYRQPSLGCSYHRFVDTSRCRLYSTAWPRPPLLRRLRLLRRSSSGRTKSRTPMCWALLLLRLG